LGYLTLALARRFGWFRGAFGQALKIGLIPFLKVSGQFVRIG